MKISFPQIALVFFLGFISVNSQISAQTKSRMLPTSDFDNTHKARSISRNQKISGVEKHSARPVTFEENKGQTAADIKYLARGTNHDLYLTRTEAIFSLGYTKGKKRTNSTVKMKFLGANNENVLLGTDQTITKTNYFIGADESKWLAEISNYEKVVYTNLYDGIDAIFYGAGPDIQYDFRISPGGNSGLIKMEFEGARRIRIDGNGDLVLKTPAGELRHRKPVAYQLIDGQRQEIPVKFSLLGNKRIGFVLGTYDQSKELVIDPIIYSGDVVPSPNPLIHDVAVDSLGNTYLLSRITGTGGGGGAEAEDIAVTKLNADGSQIIYNTVLGGSSFDDPYAIDVDAAGSVYFGGFTTSPNFPLVNERQSISDQGFVTKLSPAGTLDPSVAYSTYHGAQSYNADWVDSLAVDSSGNAYAVGYTCGTDFPVLQNAYQPTIMSGYCGGFLSKFNTFGQLTYSTYFGNTDESPLDVAVDGSGIAYIAGQPGTATPVTPGAYMTSGNGSNNGFVAKFNTNVSGTASLIYSTYVDNGVSTIAIDSNGNAYVKGHGDGPPFTEVNIGVKLNATGTGIHWRFPGSYGRNPDIAVDQAGNSYFVEDFERWAEDRLLGLRVVKVSSTGNILGTARLNGSLYETPHGIAVRNGYVYVVGETTSPDFPRKNAIGGNFPGGFFTKLIIDGFEDIGDAPCQNTVGMPVNVTNGNMYLEQTDYALPSTGESINVTRKYNSMVQTSGLFGIGWSAQYDQHLMAFDSNTLRWQMPDGKAVYFTKNGSNVFEPASAGFYGRIVMDANQNYVLTLSDGRFHTFDQSGRLIGMTDRNDNHVSLSYS